MADYRNYAEEERADREAARKVERRVKEISKRLVSTGGFPEKQARAIAEAILAETQTNRYFYYREGFHKRKTKTKVSR